MKETEAVALHVRNVATGLNSLLDPLEFVLEREAQRLDKIVLFAWRQRAKWRILEVRLWHYKRHPSSLTVDLSVYVPDIEKDGERILDGRTVEFLVGRSKPYDMPSFFARVVGRSSSRFARKICADTAKALQWFELFASPEKCLVQLRTGKTNGAGPVGKGPHPWFESYFAQLIDSAPPKTGDT